MFDCFIDRLRRVLVAYSWRNPDIGYCQSMVSTQFVFHHVSILHYLSRAKLSVYYLSSFIQLDGQNFVASLLLLYMSEESAFWMLCTICEDIVPQYYHKAMVGSIGTRSVINQTFCCQQIMTCPFL